MDSHISAIKARSRETNDHIHTRIMAYSAKYASAFYGPFRDAPWARPATSARQQEGLPDGSGQQRRSAAQVALDLAGAGMVMVKPGMPTHIGIVRHRRRVTGVPTFTLPG
jgi:porphobilinogen synthase